MGQRKLTETASIDKITLRNSLRLLIENSKVVLN